jgi:hypothetical protein
MSEKGQGESGTPLGAAAGAALGATAGAEGGAGGKGTGAVPTGAAAGAAADGAGGAGGGGSQADQSGPLEYGRGLQNFGPEANLSEQIVDANSQTVDANAVGGSTPQTEGSPGGSSRHPA